MISGMAGLENTKDRLRRQPAAVGDTVGAVSADRREDFRVAALFRDGDPRPSCKQHSYAGGQDDLCPRSMMPSTTDQQRTAAERDRGYKPSDAAIEAIHHAPPFFFRLLDSRATRNC